MIRLLTILSFLPLALSAQPPNVSAGSTQTIQNPASTVTLTGTASGNGGATIVSQKWTCVADPSNGGMAITNSTSLITGVTGLSLWGNFVYKLVVTDSHGVKDSAYTRVNVLPACNPGPYHRYNLTASGGGIFFPRARTQPWLGGDTLVLPAGYLGSDIIFGGSGAIDGGNDANGLSGDPCHPIYIMGPDAGTDSSNIIRFDDHCQYIKFIQNPNNPLKYAIRTYTAAGALSNNFEIAWIHIDGFPIHGAGATGIIWKRHIDTTATGAICPETILGNYLMNNIHFHDLQIDSSDGEGMYIGSTAPEGGDGQGPAGFYPVRMQKVEIDHVHVLHSGWDGIQLSGATDSCSTHDNNVYNYGVANMGSQQAGIIAGGVCNTQVYNDTVILGTGNGLQEFGYGDQPCHDMIFDSCGRDGTGSGQATIFQDDIPDTVVTPAKPAQKIVYYNVYIKHPQTFGAIRIQNDRGSGGVDTIRDDNFCIPGQTSGTYYANYVFTSPTAVNFGNALCTNCSLIPPTASAGSNQVVIGSASTLSGSAVGNGGATISSTSWTQRTGPNSAGITSPSSLASAITGLITGNYSFEIKAVDSNGLVNVNDVMVAVNLVRIYLIFHRLVKVFK